VDAMRSRCLLLTLLSTALLLAIPLGASARTSFERPTTLSPISKGTPYGDPQMAEGPDGTVTFVWSKTIYSNPSNPFNTAEIQIRRIAPDGTLSPVLTVDAGDAAAYYVDPQVAVDDDGRALIAWADTGGTINAAPLSADGQLGPTQVVGAGLASSFGPQLVIDDSGQAFVSWLGADHRIRVAAVAPDGTPEATHVIEGAGNTRLVGGPVPRIIWADGGRGVFSARLESDGTPSATVMLVRGAPHVEFDPIQASGAYVVIGRQTFAKVQVGKVLLARVDGSGSPRVLDRAPLPYPSKPGSIFSGFGIDFEKGRAVVSWRERVRNRPHAPSRVHAALVGVDDSIVDVASFGAKRVLMTAAVFGPKGDPVVGWAGDDGIRIARIKRSGRIRTIQRVPGSESRSGERGLRMLATQAGLRVTWEGRRTGLDRRILTSVDG
jgi:hypothetical protein